MDVIMAPWFDFLDADNDDDDNEFSPDVMATTCLIRLSQTSLQRDGGIHPHLKSSQVNHKYQKNTLWNRFAALLFVVTRHKSIQSAKSSSSSYPAGSTRTDDTSSESSITSWTETAETCRRLSESSMLSINRNDIMRGNHPNVITKSVRFDLDQNVFIAPDHHTQLDKKILWWNADIKEGRRSRDCQRVETKSGVQSYLRECQEVFDFFQERVLQTLSELQNRLGNERDGMGSLSSRQKCHNPIFDTDTVHDPMSESDIDQLMSAKFIAGLKHGCRGLERLPHRQRARSIVRAILGYWKEQPDSDRLAMLTHQICMADRYWAHFMAMADHRSITL